MKKHIQVLLSLTLISALFPCLIVLQEDFKKLEKDFIYHISTLVSCQRFSDLFFGHLMD